MESGFWVFLSSVLVREEIEVAPQNVRDLYTNTYTAEEVLLAFEEEMESLAEAYVSQGVVSQKFIKCAGHVAIATVCRVDYLVSWNFKHLVNVEREKGFNAVNLLLGWQPIRIVNPLELIYGKRAENL